MTSDIPSAVRLVQDFVNTSEPQLGTEGLTADGAASALAALGLASADEELTDEDVDVLIRVREGIRGLLLLHAGHGPTEGPAVAALDDELAQIPLTVGLQDGHPVYRPVDGRVAHHVVAALLTSIGGAAPDEWGRLKVCARDSCRWAFYDASRNRSGRWCSMSGCGNIVKLRRARSRQTPETKASDAT